MSAFLAGAPLTSGTLQGAGSLARMKKSHFFLAARFRCMNALQEQTVSVVRDLIATCHDGQQGFRTASEHVTDDPELKMLLSSFSLQCSRFAGELENDLITIGEHHPEHEGGHLSGAIHRGWMNLRGAVGQMDNHSILAECEREMDGILSSYDKALTHELADPLRQTVQRQRGEFITTHNTVKALRDATPEQTSKVLESFRQTAQSAREKVRQKGEQAAAGAEQAWGEMKEKTEQARVAGEEAVQRNPLGWLGGALLLGFGLGMAFYLIELRNERIRLEIRHRPLRRMGTALTGWLGYLAGRARSGYESSVDQVQSIRVPRRWFGFRRGNRLSRPLRSAWERVAG